jgi:hypothetical protein
MSKTITITRDAILSADVTRAMLIELATRQCGYAAQTAAELADKTLSKPSALLKKLDCQKLRTLLIQKLELVAGFTEGKFTFAFTCLKADNDDMDIGNAGKNNGGSRKTSSKLTGEYHVARRTTNDSSNGGDAGKWEIWQHIWTCTTFEDFFAKAPAKAQKKSGTIITPASEMNYAIRSGMIKVGPKPAAQ